MSGLDKLQHVKPADIEARSFEIISAELAEKGVVLDPANELVIKRFLESESGSVYRLQPLARGEKPLAVYRSPLSAEGCDAHFAAVLRRVR